MRLDIVNGSVVTGDGKSLLENTSVIVRDGFISDLPRVRYVLYNSEADRVINAKGGFILPGLINIHAHGLSFGPFFPYAWKPMSKERIMSNLDTHLLQGTTTLLNCDGLVLPSDVEAANKLHPANIRLCTLHTPKNLKAAEVIAGYGLEERHRKFTAEESWLAVQLPWQRGSAAGTSYGTAEKNYRLGITMSARQALALDTAVFAGDEERIRKALSEAGLEKLTIADGKKLVEDTSVAPLRACLEAIQETVFYVEKSQVPTLVHTDTETAATVLEVARELGPSLIALHVNHTFTLSESIRMAKELRKAGVAC